MSSLGNRSTHIPELEAESFQAKGSARVAVYWHLPVVLRDFGVDIRDVLDTAGVRADTFDDPENPIAFADLGRLLLECERRTNCDHISLLLTQRIGLADLGLAGQIALYSATVGEALRRLSDHFYLHNTAATVSVITSGAYTRLVYAVSEHGLVDSRHFQLGAMVIAYNVVRELCGPGWQPTVVTIASRAPANLQPCQRFFRAPLRFDSPESALVFERHWLDRSLPPGDPLVRLRLEAAVRARRESTLRDLPASVRHILRRRLLIGPCSMEDVAAVLGMHRRTLDRHLQEHGVQYGELLESVKDDVARQLLRDTKLQVQQIAESLHFSSAANFATAFRRWAGMTPSEYRRQAS